MKKYDLFIIVLAITSIVLTILDFSGSISLSESPYLQLDWTILAIFACAYFTRFAKAKDKAKFFRQNIFDLLAIIPLDSMLAIFKFFRIFKLTRVTRVTRLFRFTRLIRIFGVSGKLNFHLKRFFNTNRFLYLLYASFTLLFIVSIIYSIFEKMPFIHVASGNVSPVTAIGKVTSVALIVLGISIIGLIGIAFVSVFNKKLKIK
ncbi:ion transporter [Lactococcus hodotermopsidis]|uniref:Ion transporter n=1 Tax=Pseudolactococcus hodotermopsidis TaxID=2709157 RepID=A0A6A0BBU3_9LACT|nr:ion transporter [Lactococcus hodotermopsidis]GFH41888.1 ion transporter [Lactococcus hodotermopsidis]